MYKKLIGRAQNWKQIEDHYCEDFVINFQVTEPAVRSLRKRYMHTADMKALMMSSEGEYLLETTSFLGSKSIKRVPLYKKQSHLSSTAIYYWTLQS